MIARVESVTAATPGALQAAAAVRDRAGREHGVALLATVLVLAVLFTLGVGILCVSTTAFQGARAYSAATSALHVADAGIQHVVARQNDLYLSPRYLFSTAAYQSSGASPFFVDYPLSDPETGESIGRATRQVIGKDPRIDPPPYLIESTGTYRNSQRVVRAAVAPISLLEYAVYSEDQIQIAANITLNGKVYSATSITLTGPPITFNADLEYVGSLTNPGNGTYNGAVKDLGSAYPSLTTLVDLTNFENASKLTGACTSGIGLYIGPDPGARHNALFQRSAGVYQIDLTLFDFSGPTRSPATAITYNGTSLLRFDNGAPLIAFNGIIFVDGELHVWGIDGGRSVEDSTVLDSSKPLPSAARYPGPAGAGNNLYSNNQLDPGEDGTGGGTVNGILDPRGRGQSLTIVTKGSSDIVIDHNVFTGTAPDGRPVRMALISGDALYIESTTPKAIVIEAALLARGEDSAISWQPRGDATTHQDNYWARRPDGSYAYDLDGDGSIDANNGLGQPGDRNETTMLSAWSLQNVGNLITYRQPVSGIWASGGHIRIYAYDPILVIAEPPCYPVIPFYGIVPGTWREMR